MSDIDLIQHARVGLLSELPVYLCLEDGCWLGKQHEMEPSSVARKHALCVGGGSGEHPSAVLNAPWDSVPLFVDFVGGRSCPPQKPPCLIFCDGMTQAQWEQEFRKSYEIYSDSLSFTHWMMACLGEFVYFMLPDLHPSIRQIRNSNPDPEIVKPFFETLSIPVPWRDYGGNGYDYFDVKPRK